MKTYRLDASVEFMGDPIKGSKFLGWALPCTLDELKPRLLEAKQRWPDVSHRCWAWVGESESEQKFSDDGEPSGSAGRPILNVLLGQSLRDSLVVVIRWYGGTKLGTGGLVRAYGGAANQVLSLATLSEIVPMTAFKFICPYDKWPALEHQLKNLLTEEPSLQFDTQIRGIFHAPSVQSSEIRKVIEAHYPASLLEEALE